MRSFILSAAIAAVMASTPFTIAQAASFGGKDVGNASTGASRGMGDTSTNGGKGVGETGGEPDWSAPSTTIVPQSFSMVRPQPRLEQLKAELNDAASRIALERRHGQLTPRAAHIVLQDEASISEAVQGIADRDNGAIGARTYARLEGRIARLDRMIDRYSTHA